jgi:LL-diaminopimelate aminotransferase
MCPHRFTNFPVAIEIRSFSKWAGFTGLRCGYTVIPKTLHQKELNPLWQKRIDIKTNGISYPIQKGALACFREDVEEELRAQLSQYQTSAKILRETLQDLGQTFFGGTDAPYIFWKCPTDSWAFFDELLTRSRILTIPGSGFGPAGEGFVRLSCFISPSTAQEVSHALYHHFATA